MDPNLLTAIEVLRARIRSKEEDVVRLKRTVNEMCVDAGQDAPYSNLGSSDGAGDISSLRSDHFYGHAISGAAKAYLEMRRSAGLGAAPVNEIYAALKNGGYKFEAKDDENAKNGLRISLRKNSSIFHRVPGGEYGLLAWYPKAKAPKEEGAEDEEEEEEEQPEKPRKKRGKPRMVPTMPETLTLESLIKAVRAKSARVNTLAAQFRVSEERIKALINEDNSGLEIAERGWVKTMPL